MSRGCVKLCLGLAVLLQAHSLFGQEPTNRLSDAEIAAIDEAMQQEMKTHRIVGCAVGILRNGEVVFTRGYGLANRRTREPATDETVFNWASNSKPLIAFLAMQLVQEGKLDLDADVRKYVPEFPDKKQTITVRHLLTHQSGIPHYSNGRVVATRNSFSKLEDRDPVIAIQHFDRSPLLFDPGTKFEYSTYAYILLSAVVQRAANQPLEELLRTRIITPLAMESLQLDLPTRNQEHWSQGYRPGPGSQMVESPEEANYWKHGGGGYKSNVRDFARFAQAIARYELIDESTSKQMWTVHNTSDGKKTPYGLGVILDAAPSEGVKVSHNGNQREASTRLVVYPGPRSGIVLMTNVDGVVTGRVTTAVFAALSKARAR